MANLPSDAHKATGGLGVSSDIGNTNSDSNLVDQTETQSAVAGIVDDSDEAAAAVAGLAQDMSPAAEAMYSLQSSPAAQNDSAITPSGVKNTMSLKGKEEESVSNIAAEIRRSFENDTNANTGGACTEEGGTTSETDSDVTTNGRGRGRGRGRG